MAQALLGGSGGSELPPEWTGNQAREGNGNLLKVVLPKGSLERATLALFEAADLPVERSSDRAYHGRIADPRVERVSLLRPQEIPRYVEEGFFDLGITGRDWVEETGSKVVSLAQLPYSKQTSNPIRVVLAVHRDVGVERPEQLKPGLRVSTEFPNLTRRYFEELGLPARIFPSYGATEAKVPEIVDAVVDLTETGSTLRNHGMVVIDTLLTSYTEVVANAESAADPERRQAMDDLVTLLVGAITARSKTLVKLNVADEHLQAVLAVLPAMKAPTVTALADSGYHAVETVVDKERVNRVITALKAAGAFDILELPIAKIVL
jgi:ATP phosphoribosyltransferase